ncbi:MAG: winged helix-turn-helix domain-containing protein [Caulobacter sp.]|nr:winged helix-turn-helix domain-containing protein [Caulobacter sp.]
MIRSKPPYTGGFKATAHRNMRQAVEHTTLTPEREQPVAARLAFGRFALSPSERLLTKDGIPVEIGGRSLDLLLALVTQPGRVLPKRELLSRVWPDVVVEDASLRFHMANLRKILGDGEDGARFISTQVGVGYAFVASVQGLTPAVTPAGQPPLAGRLPPRPTYLVGRADDVRSLIDRIGACQLLTVVGAGGVGKTTLAIETAYALVQRFAEGVSFVDLATLQDDGLVSSAIASALGITVQAEDPMVVVLGHLRDQERLIVLDNCEHLIDAVSRIVERMLEVAPRLAILATSREALRVRGEQVHWLASLDYPGETAGLTREQLLAFPAVELFVARASSAGGVLANDLEAVQVVADMCRRLDGMALPIELAAVRVAAHGVHATARLLGERLSLGWSGRRTALPRQQTLQATLDWSYGLLSEAERLTFDRLSVFLGAFSIEAALEVVVDDDLEIDVAAAALDELTAKSLISPDRLGGGGGYRLLEMTRAYARGKLLNRGRDDYNATARRHATRVLNRLVASEVWRADGGELRQADLSLRLGQIRAALEWSFGADGDLDLAIPLAAASAPALLNLSLLAECRTWCARATAQLPDAHRGGSIELELQAALGLSLMFTRGNSDAAEKALRRALDVAAALGDRWNQLRILGRLHIFHERIGDFETALGWAATAVEVADAIAEPEALAVAASLSGVSHHLAGDQALARSELELALKLGLPSERGRTTYYGFDHRNRSGIALARTLWLQGYAERARRVASDTLRAAGQLQHPITHCIALIWTLSIHLWTADLDEAEDGLRAFAKLATVNGFGPYIAASGGFRGELAVRRGQGGEALGWIEESLARLHAARYELLTTSFSLALSQGLVLDGRSIEALDLLNATIDQCMRNGERLFMSELLRTKAAALGRKEGGDGRRAEALLLEAMAWARRQGARAWELRVAIDLADLLVAQGRKGEALAALEPLLASFSEGHDTADHLAAHRILDDLVAEAG